MSPTPPPGVPPLIPTQRELEAALGGKPLPPPEIRVQRAVTTGQQPEPEPAEPARPEIRIARADAPPAAPAPEDGQDPAEPAPEPAPAVPENPIKRLSGTFAPVEVIPSLAASTLTEARNLLAQIVNSIHHANLNFERVATILSPHAEALKKIHGYDIEEAREFLAAANALLNPEPAKAKTSKSKKD